MTVYLAGAGCGPETWTAALQEALRHAVVVAGPDRLLASVSGLDGMRKKQVRQAVLPEEILAAIDEAEQAGGDCLVLFSGDSGFYSGVKRLLPLLAGYTVHIDPGISSVQLLAARLGRSWQDWRLCSAHGVACDAVREVCHGKPVFFLTGGKLGPAELCARLVEAGLEELAVTVGEDLGTETEKILRGTAGAFAGQTFSPLSVLLAEAAPNRVKRAPGFADELFLREETVPMTKQAVRAVILSQLHPRAEDVCWDVGAGTGSVGIELAMLAGRVYGVEQKPQALALAEKNRRALGAWNLYLSAGTAPEALEVLPAPDAVFVGGSGGRLAEILQCIHEKNPAARVCVSAIVLEHAAEAASVLGKLGCRTEILQIGISHSRKLGGNHMMTAQNPVYLIVGQPS